VFSTAFEMKSRGVLRSAHGLVCLLGSLGHSARARQTLAKKIIKAKIAAGIKTKHKFNPFIAPNLQKNTGSPLPCQAFSEAVLPSEAMETLSALKDA
jgi:hypothetical protein